MYRLDADAWLGAPDGRAEYICQRRAVIRIGLKLGAQCAHYKKIAHPVRFCLSAPWAAAGSTPTSQACLFLFPIQRQSICAQSPR